MYVLKRDGSREAVDFNKIAVRIESLTAGLSPAVDSTVIAQKVVSGLFPGVTTVELDGLAAETAAAQTLSHPDFATLAARLCVSNLQKETPAKFSAAVAALRDYTEPTTGEPAALVSEQLYSVVQAHAEQLDGAIRPERDFDIGYFGFKTLERAYLLRCDKRIVERPCYMYMRVALGIHGTDIPAALETYDLLSRGMFTHATPTLFNAGTPRSQLASCFLLTMQDSIEGIYKTLADCALISKTAGGLGVCISDIRASGSYIRGTGGHSNGIIPMCRVFNASARFVDQGGGKRPGSIATYLECHHPDIEAFLDLRKNSGNEHERCRDLFLALWVSDLFMERVEAGGDWSLFCPAECPGLSDLHGDEYKHLYELYEQGSRARKTLNARSLWNKIVTSQIETGTPYILFKDACNSKSNQKNLGTIKCSNLCSDESLTSFYCKYAPCKTLSCLSVLCVTPQIIQYTSPTEAAVCNLASLSLPAFVKEDYSGVDLQELSRVAGVVVRNLNKVIDTTYYPIPEAKNSNLKHRPLGLGVQGLADVFYLLKLPFDSPKALELNEHMFEAIHYGALQASMQLAREHGPYDSYTGSPMSAGLLQADLWGTTLTDERFDWSELRSQIAQYGVRNSLLMAQMPTASTASILGNVESTEVLTSNAFVRRVSSGEFVIINKHLVRDLLTIDKWTPETRNQLLQDEGSVQQLDIPDDLKAVYRTAWEVSQRSVIDMAAARGPFICQSESLNLFVAAPSLAKISSMLFHGWKQGLKTGMYYLRTQPKSAPIKFTVDAQAAAVSAAAAVAAAEGKACLRSDPDCEACSG